jgi:restriction system protein
MGRRKESVFDILMQLPWWVGIASGIVGYIAIAVVVPAWLNASNPLFKHSGVGLRPVASIWLGMCCFAAFVSFIRSKFVSRKFDRQRSINDIRGLSWQSFESIVGEAFRRKGYSVIENGGGGADGGIDLVLRKDGQKFFVQCKQWKVFSVGVKPIRELAGVVSARDAAGGFFVSSGRYTEEARRFGAEANLQLIDGAELEQMIKAVQSQSESLQDVMPAVVSRAVPINPACPKCAAPMIRRTAKKGSNAGDEFWGCSQFPKCRGTQRI